MAFQEQLCDRDRKFLLFLQVSPRPENIMCNTLANLPPTPTKFRGNFTPWMRTRYSVRTSRMMA